MRVEYDDEYDDDDDDIDNGGLPWLRETVSFLSRRR
jgi:hypothetical protein